MLLCHLQHVGYCFSSSWLVMTLLNVCIVATPRFAASLFSVVPILFQVLERFAVSGYIYPAYRNRNRNRKLQTSKAPLKSQAQGTSLFTSAASNQRVFPKNSPWEAQVR